MVIGGFEKYLLIINIIGFIMFLVNYLLYTYTSNGQIDKMLTTIALIGGTAGIVVSMHLIDRKAVKENMMSRVFAYCILVVQIILFLIIKGYIAEEITLNIIKFFCEHKIIIFYVLLINLVTFLVYAIDKYAAIQRKSRIRIVTLLGLAFIGGSIGAITAMYLLRHKTLKDYFAVGVPMIMVMQVVVLFYWMNAVW